MESPFYPNGITGNNQSFTLFLTPIYDSLSQTYMNVITLSCVPEGPLKHLVKLMSFPKLSIFKGFKNGYKNNGNALGNNSSDCIFVLQRYLSSYSSSNSVNNRCKNYMFAEDITAVFSYLTNNGYTIEKSISKMMNESRVVMGSNGNNNHSMICIASFNGSMVY